jgi:hypothetical protein
MYKVLSTVAAGIVLVVLVLGCAGSAPGKTASAGRNVAGFPTGRFLHEFEFWAFEFDEDGTWRGYEGDVETPVISGKYATNGNLYTEMTHDYPTSPMIPATYFWKYEGNKLTFELWGEDVNSHRKSVYDGQTYLKVD